MKAEEVAKTIIDNIINDTNLTVADIIIERNQCKNENIYFTFK